ncbi:MAG: SIS domain-containing protein [Nocardioides sp.]
MTWFDESRLDNEVALSAADLRLRSLAESGSRVRAEYARAQEAIADAVDRASQQRPRAVVAAGPDSRLLRAVLEPWCPVPFVAWPNPGLPGWAGPMDLVVVLAPDGSDVGAASAVAEAIRRGCQVVVACHPNSLVGEHATGRDVTILPAAASDQTALAVAMLAFLAQVQLGPATDPESVAVALDEVAIANSPHRDLSINPGKLLAISLADSVPVVWGGSVLAARAARRVAEAIRRASGRTSIAGDADQLFPVIEASRPHDVFDDPFADESRELRPILVVLDDANADPAVVAVRKRLVAEADHRGVRVEIIDTSAGSEIARYAALMLQGRYAAEYLGIGLVDD